MYPTQFRSFSLLGHLLSCVLKPLTVLIDHITREIMVEQSHTRRSLEDLLTRGLAYMADQDLIFIMDVRLCELFNRYIYI